MQNNLKLSFENFDMNSIYEIENMPNRLNNKKNNLK